MAGAEDRAPAGTVALLFCDIEGSTRLVRRLGTDAWAEVLAAHHRLLGDAIRAEGGFVDGAAGDEVFATWSDPPAAARAAVAAQRALRAHRWPGGLDALRVRMGLHVGPVRRVAGRYVGIEVHRAARVAAAAHGGQLLLTGAAEAAVRSELAARPLGAHRLRGFPAAETLFSADIDGQGFPPPRTLDVRRTNLPAARRGLVGRAAELRDGEGRLVTLTGRGGSGKTSLALAVGDALLDAHPGGVWWLALATVRDPAVVLPGLAALVGAAKGEDPVAAIGERLAGAGPALLVLDNVEQLPGLGARLEALLDAVPPLRVLATSQLPLRVGRERRVVVEPLTGADGAELVRRTVGLLGGRAPADDEDLRALVTALDGLPLALELAAARLRVLSPAALLHRLAATDDVLRDARGDRPERQRSLGATLDASLGLLSEDARRLFARCGAFAGAVELEELEAVAAGDRLDVLAELEALLDVALVRRVEPGDGSTRFGLPEALRRAAAARLDAGPDGHAVRRAHAERQRDVAWAARLGALAPLGAFRRASRLDEEARAALRWAWAHAPEVARPLAVARALRLADLGALRAASDVLDRLRADPGGDPVVHALALVADGFLALVAGRLDASAAAYAAAATTSPDPVVALHATTGRGFCRLFAGNPAGAVDAAAEATVLARGIGPTAAAAAMLYEAQAHMVAGDAAAATRLVERVERAAPAEPPKLLLLLEGIRADLALLRRELPAARGLYARSLTRRAAEGDDLQVSFDLLGLANALAAAGADGAALEVQGVAEAHAEEMTGGEAVGHFQGDAELRAAGARLGEDEAARWAATGRAVPAAARVARACELAASA